MKPDNRVLTGSFAISPQGFPRDLMFHSRLRLELRQETPATGHLGRIIQAATRRRRPEPLLLRTFAHESEGPIKK